MEHNMRATGIVKFLDSLPKPLEPGADMAARELLTHMGTTTVRDAEPLAKLIRYTAGLEDIVNSGGLVKTQNNPLGMVAGGVLTFYICAAALGTSAGIGVLLFRWVVGL